MDSTADPLTVDVTGAPSMVEFLELNWHAPRIMSSNSAPENLKVDFLVGWFLFSLKVFIILAK